MKYEPDDLMWSRHSNQHDNDGEVHACTFIILHACTIAQVHACTLAKVHARAMAKVHACALAIVHLRQMFQWSANAIGEMAPFTVNLGFPRRAQLSQCFAWHGSHCNNQSHTKTFRSSQHSFCRPLTADTWEATWIATCTLSASAGHRCCSLLCSRAVQKR